MKNTNKEEIDKINHIVRTRVGAEELPELIIKVDENTGSAVNALSFYLIDQNDDELLGMLLSNQAALDVLDGVSIWERACRGDNANVMDVCLAALGKLNLLSEDKIGSLYSNTIKQESLYGIKLLNELSHSDLALSKNILSIFPAISLDFLNAAIDKEYFYQSQTDGLLASLNRNISAYLSEKEIATISDWLAQQSDVIILKALNIAFNKYNKKLLLLLSAELSERFSDYGAEALLAKSLPSDYPNLLISDNRLELFRQINGSKLITNSKALHESLESLMERADSIEFIRHLVLSAMPEVKDFICKTLNMPYDRLELRKTSRPLFDIAKEKTEIVQTCYVAIMIDKFGVAEFARHASSEFHIKRLLELGYAPPLEVLQYLQDDELKLYLLSCI